MRYLPLLEKLAESVRSSVLRIYGSEDASRALSKGASGDVTKVIDKVAEDAVLEVLRGEGFKGSVVSEEGGVIELGGEPLCIVLDPVDGTTNATRQVPFFCSSIALSTGRRLKDVVAGVVVEFPSGRVFKAEKGYGAYLEDRRLHVVKRDFREAVVGVNLNIKRKPEVLDALLPVIKASPHVRLFGSVALELCYIAMGGLDAFIDARGLLRVVDVAAAKVILEEAGGLMLSLQGEPLDAELTPTTRVSFLAASTREIAEELLKRLSF